MQARGGGPDIDSWIAEVQSGGGDLPTGAIKEYIMKWFWPAADPFTGPGGTPGKKDHKKVFEILKRVVQLGPAFDRGSSSAGFASVNGETSGVDGSPYSWLVGSMTPGGMYLFVTREFPGGMGVRPLLACKIGEEEKLWSSVNWNIVNKRLDIRGRQLGARRGDEAEVNCWISCCASQHMYRDPVPSREGCCLASLSKRKDSPRDGKK